ncbi:hypothetical protein B0H14DRAFT_3525367 [Mycena olivaceomarginata]|nr:hypothetical protein B0H14DRAFT_3525367 [Mycena olivaceomarginata]
MHSIFIRICQRAPALPIPGAPPSLYIPYPDTLDQSSGHIRPTMGTSKKLSNARSARAHERSSVSGAGAHYTSPLKPRAAKNQQIARGFGTAARLQALHTRMASRKNPAALPGPSEPDLASSSMADPHEDVAMPDWVDEPPEIPEISTPPFLPPTLVPLPGSGAQNKARRQCAAWDLLLPKLARPYSHYQLSSYAQPPPPIPSIIRFECLNSCVTSLVTQIQCLYISRK